MQCKYLCPKCGATKKLVKPEWMSREQFEQSLHEHLFCGYSGCDGIMSPKYGREDG